MPAQRIIDSLTQGREVTMKACLRSVESSIYELQVILDGAKTLHITQSKISQALALLRQTREELQRESLSPGRTAAGKQSQMRTLEPSDLAAMRRPSRGHSVPGVRGWACDPVQGKIT
jgi:hypothetical protein